MQFTAFWRIFTGRAQAKVAPTGNLTLQTFRGEGSRESRNSGRLSSHSHSERNRAHRSSGGIATQAVILQKLGRLFTHSHGHRHEQLAGGAAVSLHAMRPLLQAGVTPCTVQTPNSQTRHPPPPTRAGSGGGDKSEPLLLGRGTVTRSLKNEVNVSVAPSCPTL